MWFHIKTGFNFLLQYWTIWWCDISNISAKAWSWVVVTCFLPCALQFPTDPTIPYCFISCCFTLGSLPDPYRLATTDLELPALFSESLFMLCLCKPNSWFILWYFLFPSVPVSWVQLFFIPVVLWWKGNGCIRNNTGTHICLFIPADFLCMLTWYL